MSRLAEVENRIINAQAGGQALSFGLTSCATDSSIFPDKISITPKWHIRKKKQEEEERQQRKLEEAQQRREEELRKKKEEEERLRNILMQERLRRGTGEPVDMGVSVLWASHNLGARGSEQPGVYSTWLNKDESLELWGEDWRFPTQQEMMELMQRCKWMWTLNNGMPGFVVIASNGNRIFLPAGGSCIAQQYDSYGIAGRYWCDTFDNQYPERAMYLEFNQCSGNIYSITKTLQMNVRPVKDRN